MQYSVDTSALLDGWVRLYPPDTFPIVWEKMKELAETGVLLISEEVLLELKKKDDGAYLWAKEILQVRKTDEKIQQVVADILKTHEKLLDTRHGRSAADPFVIAIAMIEGCCVLTGERPTGSLDRPNIPDVCAAYKIKTMYLLDFIRSQKWKFS